MRRWKMGKKLTKRGVPPRIRNVHQSLPHPKKFNLRIIATYLKRKMRILEKIIKANPIIPKTAPTDSTSSSTSQLKEKKKKTGKSYDYAT